MGWAAKYADREAFAAVSDIISGMTADVTGGSRTHRGHAAAYWAAVVPDDAASVPFREAWADYCPLRALHNTEMLELLDKVAPARSAALEQVYREVYGA